MNLKRIISYILLFLFFFFTPWWFFVLSLFFCIILFDFFPEAMLFAFMFDSVYKKDFILYGFSLTIIVFIISALSVFIRDRLRV